jgi:hypothetical protein
MRSTVFICARSRTARVNENREERTEKREQKTERTGRLRPPIIVFYSGGQSTPLRTRVK